MYNSNCSPTYERPDVETGYGQFELAWSGSRMILQGSYHLAEPTPLNSNGGSISDNLDWRDCEFGSNPFYRRDIIITETNKNLHSKASDEDGSQKNMEMSCSNVISFG